MKALNLKPVRSSTLGFCSENGWHYNQPTIYSSQEETLTDNISPLYLELGTVQVTQLQKISFITKTKVLHGTKSKK